MNTTHRNLRLRLFALLSLISLTTGCASNLYLAESEVLAFAANMRTAQNANQLFADLNGEVIDVRFTTTAGGRFDISSSNTLAMLRTMQRLEFVENAFYQINLERLAMQLDRQFETWVNSEIRLATGASGSQVDITRVTRVTFGLHEAPTFSYDAASQSIQFQLRANASIHGRIHHRIVSDDIGGDFLGFFIDLFEGSGTAEGTNDVTISAQDLVLNGQLHLNNAYRDAAQVRLELSPQLAAANVVVTGSAPDQVRDGIRTIIHRNLAASRVELHTLGFEYFSVPRLQLTTNASGVAELHAGYRASLDYADAEVDIVARQRDSRLYHYQRNADGFAEPKVIPLRERVASDPALVAAAPGLLEMAVVLRGGDIAYKRYRDGGWRDEWHTSDDGDLDRYRTDQRMALAATAPGQIEIVAVRNNGYLYHLRRRNGSWAPPVGVSAINNVSDGGLQDPLFVRTGTKVLLIAWDNGRNAQAAVFDLESQRWGQSFIIAGNLKHPPAAVALNDWRVGVAYVDRQDNVRFRVVDVHAPMFLPNVGTTGASLGPDAVIGADVNGPPELAATGPNSALLAVRGDDRLLHFNRIIGSSWQGWDSTREQFFGTSWRGRIDPEFALVSSAAGQLYFAGRRSSFASSRLLFNKHPGWANFPGGTPGVFHWRGHENVGPGRFPGRPAISVNDRAMAAVVQDSIGRPWSTVLGDERPARFRLSDQPAASWSDPAALVTHTGRIDVLFATANGALRHARNHLTQTLSGIDNLPFGPTPYGDFAAVAGPDQIDVVALGRDRSLYYSRYRRGAWNGVVGLGNNIASAPALVDTGSGQYEIFAVDAEGALWRSRLRDGALTPMNRIETPFAVSPVWFGPRSAATYGDGTVDLVLAEQGSGDLYHVRFRPNRNQAPIDPASERSLLPFQPLDVTTSDRPILTAIGHKQFQLLVPTANDVTLAGHMYVQTVSARLPIPGPNRTTVSAGRVGSSQVLWSDFVPMNPGPGHIASAARLGDSELATVVSSAQGRLLVRRHDGDRWTAPEPVYGELAPVSPNRPNRVAVSPLWISGR